MTRVGSMTLFAAVGVILAGCSSTPPSTPDVPSATAEPVPAEAPAAPAAAAAAVPEIKDDATLQAWLDAPCFAINADASQVACGEGNLEMGFIDAGVSFIDATTGKVLRRVPVYNGRSEFEAAKLDGAAVEKLNGELEAGGFVAAGKRLPAGDVKLADATLSLDAMKAPLPGFDKDHAPAGFSGDPGACMSWEISHADRFDQLAVVRLSSRHRFTMEGTGPCVVKEELNDETFPAATRWVVLK